MQIQNIVLTGPAYTATGEMVLRDDIIRQANNAGYKIQSSVQRTTDCLVASRTDTAKARKARENGLLVLTYAQLFQIIGETKTRNEQGANHAGVEYL